MVDRKHGGKMRKCWLPAFSRFPTFSKCLFYRGVKSRMTAVVLSGMIMWQGSILIPVSTFQESDYFTQQGEFRVDASGSQTLLNCLMYKLSYYRFGELQVRGNRIMNHYLKMTANI